MVRNKNKLVGVLIEKEFKAPLGGLAEQQKVLTSNITVTSLQALRADKDAAHLQPLAGCIPTLPILLTHDSSRSRFEFIFNTAYH